MDVAASPVGEAGPSAGLAGPSNTDANAPRSLNAVNAEEQQPAAPDGATDGHLKRRRASDGGEVDAENQLPAKRAKRLEEVESDYECVICNELLFEPVGGPCGHVSCRLCMEKWAHTQAPHSTKCPECRQRVAPMGTSFGVCLRLQGLLERLFPGQMEQRRKETEQERTEWKTTVATRARAAEQQRAAAARAAAEAQRGHANMHPFVSALRMSVGGGSGGGGAGGGSNPMEILRRQRDVLLDMERMLAVRSMSRGELLDRGDPAFPPSFALGGYRRAGLGADRAPPVPAAAPAAAGGESGATSRRRDAASAAAAGSGGAQERGRDGERAREQGDRREGPVRVLPAFAVALEAGRQREGPGPALAPVSLADRRRVLDELLEAVRARRSTHHAPAAPAPAEAGGPPADAAAAGQGADGEEEVVSQPRRNGGATGDAAVGAGVARAGPSTRGRRGPGATPQQQQPAQQQVELGSARLDLLRERMAPRLASSRPGGPPRATAGAAAAQGQAPSPAPAAAGAAAVSVAAGGTAAAAAGRALDRGSPAAADAAANAMAPLPTRSSAARAAAVVHMRESARRMAEAAEGMRQLSGQGQGSGVHSQGTAGAAGAAGVVRQRRGAGEGASGGAASPFDLSPPRLLVPPLAREEGEEPRLPLMNSVLREWPGALQGEAAAGTAAAAAVERTATPAAPAAAAAAAAPRASRQQREQPATDPPQPAAAQQGGIPASNSQLAATRRTIRIKRTVRPAPHGADAVMSGPPPAAGSGAPGGTAAAAAAPAAAGAVRATAAPAAAAAAGGGIAAPAAAGAAAWSQAATIVQGDTGPAAAAQAAGEPSVESPRAGQAALQPLPRLARSRAAISTAAQVSARAVAAAIAGADSKDSDEELPPTPPSARRPASPLAVPVFMGELAAARAASPVVISGTHGTTQQLPASVRPGGSSHPDAELPHRPAQRASALFGAPSAPSAPAGEQDRAQGTADTPIPGLRSGGMAERLLRAARAAAEEAAGPTAARQLASTDGAAAGEGSGLVARLVRRAAHHLERERMSRNPYLGRFGQPISGVGAGSSSRATAIGGSRPGERGSGGSTAAGGALAGAAAAAAGVGTEVSALQPGRRSTPERVGDRTLAGTGAARPSVGAGAGATGAGAAGAVAAGAGAAGTVAVAAADASGGGAAAAHRRARPQRAALRRRMVVEFEEDSWDFGSEDDDLFACFGIDGEDEGAGELERMRSRVRERERERERERQRDRELERERARERARGMEGVFMGDGARGRPPLPRSSSLDPWMDWFGDDPVFQDIFLSRPTHPAGGRAAEGLPVGGGAGTAGAAPREGAQEAGRAQQPAAAAAEAPPPSQLQPQSRVQVEIIDLISDDDS